MNYNYKARDKYGKLTTGTISAEAEDAVAAHLSSMGYVPIAIEAVKSSGGIALPSVSDILKSVTLEDLTIFARQLLTLQRAGTPLLASLTVLERQTPARFFK